MSQISKSEFKARALEVLREVEQSGESKVITDRGKPTVEVRKLPKTTLPPLEALKDSVLHYDEPFSPIADDEWESA